MSRIIYPLSATKKRELFDIRRVWGANVQEHRFIETLKKYIPIDIVEIPDISGLNSAASFYTDFFESNDISLVFSAPDVFKIRYTVRNTPAFIGTIHSVGHTSVISDLILISSVFNPEFDRFVIGSKDAKSAVKKISSCFECLVYPTYGVDESLFGSVAKSRESVRDKYGIPKNDKVLLYLGRISREKNVFDLIRMFKVIHTKVPDTSLVLAGPIDPLTHPYLRLDLKNNIKMLLQKYSLSDSVFLTSDTEDFIRPSDVSSIVNACDIFLYPTIYSQETRGIAPLEANFLGLPVVATKWDGLKDSIIHGVNGFLVDVYRTERYPVVDFYQFIGYTVKLLKDNELFRRMSERSREISSNFTMTCIARSLAEDMKQLSEKYETRKTESPCLADKLWSKASDLLSSKVNQVVKPLVPDVSVIEFMIFNDLSTRFDIRYQTVFRDVIWRLIDGFASRDVSEIDSTKYGAFSTTTELIIHPFSEAKGIKSPTFPFVPFWFIYLTAYEWNRFFEIFKEIDYIPVLTPESESDYKIVEKLVKAGFVLPIIDVSF